MKTAQTEWASLDPSAVSALLTNRKMGLAYSGRRVRMGAKFATWEMSDKGPLLCFDIGAKQLITAAMLADMSVAVNASEVDASGTEANRDAPVVMGPEAQAIYDNFMAGVARREAAALEAQARADRVAS